MAGSLGRRRRSSPRRHGWRAARGRFALDEGPAQLAGRLEPVGAAGQDHPTRAVAIDVGAIDSGRHDSAVSKGPRGTDHPAPRPDDHGVRATQVLLGPVDDRPHALGDGLILLVDAGDARVALAALGLAVDEVVVLLV